MTTKKQYQLDDLMTTGIQYTSSLSQKEEIRIDDFIKKERKPLSQKALLYIQSLQNPEKERVFLLSRSLRKIKVLARQKNIPYKNFMRQILEEYAEKHLYVKA